MVCLGSSQLLYYLCALIVTVHPLVWLSYVDGYFSKCLLSVLNSPHSPPPPTHSHTHTNTNTHLPWVMVKTLVPKLVQFYIASLLRCLQHVLTINHFCCNSSHENLSFHFCAKSKRKKSVLCWCLALNQSQLMKTMRLCAHTFMHIVAVLVNYG